MSKVRSKKPRKKYNPRGTQAQRLGICEKVMWICRDDLEEIAGTIYSRAVHFSQGTATYADRTTMMIRIHAGIFMMEYFEEQDMLDYLNECLEILKDSRIKEERRIRKFTEDEYSLLVMCLGLVHRMGRSVGVWEESLATKKAEDVYIIGSDQYEYVFQKVIN